MDSTRVYLFMASEALIGLIALEHVWFAVLEMVLWQKPAGLKAFRQDAERAAATAVLAKNQGLYNLILAAGLVWSLLGETSVAWQLRVFFLSSVTVAGLFGAWTVSRRIFFVQALPALLALLIVLLN